MEKNLSNSEALKKLKELAEKVRICMFATVDTTNNLYGRPMSTAKVSEDGTIWFFTNAEQKAAQKAAGDEKVCLNYADPGSTTYMTVQGTSTLVGDKAKMKELWSPILKAWFPDGLETPGIALIKVTPEQAHYWDVDAAKLKILFATVKSALIGETTDMGKSGELKIN